MKYSVRKIGTHGTLDLLEVLITESNGQSISILNYGGIIHQWKTLDSNNQLSDILLGCKDINGYLDGHPSFGCIIGRYGNRIANGSFTIEEKEYYLAKNLAPHHLHGGIEGFDKKVWNLEIDANNSQVSVLLSYHSADMEEGYPGALKMKVCYTYSESGVLLIEYFATTNKTTHFSPTNHCYFNLSNDKESTVLNHLLQINASHYTPVNAELIPTGEITTVKDSCLDFTTLKTIGKDFDITNPILTSSNGYDHNFVVDEHAFISPVAIAIEPLTKRKLEVFSDQPGIQLYTGNWLSGQKGKEGIYKNYQGFCLETQHFPDSPNHPNFPSTILQPDQNYYSKTIYKMSTIL